jgi:4-amino-4-deoxy-L-arabinose transferase-like glycosyltransferase
MSPTQHGDAPVVTPRHAGRNRWVAAVVALLVSIPVWMMVKPWAHDRQIRLAFVPHALSAKIELEWERATSRQRNGAWLDLTEDMAQLGPQRLRIRATGEALILRVRPHGADADADPIPAAALLHARDTEVTGRWAEAWDETLHHPGPGPSTLECTVPAGGITVDLLQFPAGGTVELDYTGHTEVVDSQSPERQRVSVVLAQQRLVDGAPLDIVQPLPNYPLKQFVLRCEDFDPAADPYITLHRADVEDRVYGLLVKRFTAFPQEAGAAADGDDSATWTVHFDAARGEVELKPARVLGRTGTLVGWIPCAVIMVIGALLLEWLLWGRGGGPRRPWLRFLLLLAVIIAAHVWVGCWAPMMVSPDGFGYAVNTLELLRTGSFAHIGGVYLPGYTVFLLPHVYLLDAFLPGVQWTQVMLGVINALLAYGILRPFVPQNWALIAMALIGLNPISIVYEHFLLTEVLSGFCVLLSAYLVVLLLRPEARSAWSNAALLVALGLLIGLAPLIRGNLLLLTMLAPAALLLANLLRHHWIRGITFATTCTIIGVAGLVPWLALNYERYGTPSLAVMKGTSKFSNARHNHLIDLNQTVLYHTYKQWYAQHRQAAEHYPFPAEMYAIIDASPLAERGDAANAWMAAEQRRLLVTAESLARHAAGRRRAFWGALATHLGLPCDYPLGLSDETRNTSTVLRGTNRVPHNLFWGVAGSQHPILKRMKTPIEGLFESHHGESFGGWCRAFWAIEPTIGILFLVGLSFALRDRQWGLLYAGLLTFGNAFALAAVVGSALDRYGVPFFGPLAIVATYGLYRTFHAAHWDSQRGHPVVD